jgi:hypothetical protein
MREARNGLPAASPFRTQDDSEFGPRTGTWAPRNENGRPVRGARLWTFLTDANSFSVLPYDPGFPWQSVLLKQPGAVLSGAGVGGWFGGLFGDPGKWHCRQTGAFPAVVEVWV